MKLFIAPNSAVTFDSAMGYKNNPQLVQNQAADFLLHQICPFRSISSALTEPAACKTAQPSHARPARAGT